MATTSNVQVTISLSDPDLDDQELLFRSGKFATAG